jgi:hypothetical protein
LHNSRICCLQCNSSQGKELSQLIPHLSIPSFSNWDIWLLTQTCQCAFTWLCQCHLELEGARRPSSFYLVTFLCQKVSITLQRMQASSILNWTIAIGLATS